MLTIRKKIACIALAWLCCILSFLPCAAAEEKAAPSTAQEQESADSPIITPTAASAVQVKAKGAVLMDANTGEVLIAQNENAKLYPASVTKIMPLLLITEAIDSGKMKLTDIVTASKNAASKGGSQIWLKEGEQMTVDDLLKATAVYSANDAVTALGEHLAGSEEAFNTLLNERAKQLGMHNTHFDNCTGLDDSTTTHQTTAYDVALMSRELLKHERIINYTTIWMDSLRDGQTELVNTNKLIRFYQGITGLKTGTTNKAGCCVAASAEREGTHLIAVVMGSDNSNDRFEGAKTLLNWGFANFSTVSPQVDEGLVTNVKVIKGLYEEIQPQVPQVGKLLIPKGKEDQLKQEVRMSVTVEAPVEKGQVLGQVVFSLDGELLGEYSITAPEEVRKMTFADLLKLLLHSLAD